MAIPVHIDGLDGGRLKVGNEGEISVVVHSHPPADEFVASYPFSAFFADSAGSSDMLVNGATSPVDFFLQAPQDRDYFVTTISVLIADAGASLSNFGNLSALANGLDFIYENSITGEVIIRESIKTNLDFIRLGNASGAVGNGTSAWRSDLSGGGADAYLPSLNLVTLFGAPYGIHLRKAKKDKLIFRVNDNVSTMDEFNIIAYGRQI